MNKKRDRKCPFEECYLPDNNTKYIIQLAYLFASMLFLIKDSKEFTFFSVLMFVAPILLDLAYTTFKGKIYATLSTVFITVNACIAVFCFTGMFGFFVDSGETFAINANAMVWPGWEFDKKYLLIPMVIDLLIPIVMHKACPSKKSKAMVEFGREHRKAGNL